LHRKILLETKLSGKCLCNVLSGYHRTAECVTTPHMQCASVNYKCRARSHLITQMIIINETPSVQIPFLFLVL